MWEHFADPKNLTTKVTSVFYLLYVYGIEADITKFGPITFHWTIAICI